jgi:putative membrane protein
MSSPVQDALQSWTFPVWLTLAMVLAGFAYLRGWLHLRTTNAKVIPAWRAAGFLLGLFLAWVALGSPLAAFDEELLTVHMIQHLLLMTIAPPLILLGGPVMPLLHGLPRQFVQTVLGSVFRLPAAQRAGKIISQPAICWLAASATLVGWHVPTAFTLGLQSEAWHVVEHACFVGSGFLFWWPVVRPWPSVVSWPRWGMLLYLFLATLPCDILSGFLVFCDRVVYPSYLTAPRPFGISALEDQQCAGALMWTCVTLIYLLPAAILTIQLLTERRGSENEPFRSDRRGSTPGQNEPQSAEVA